MAVDVAVINDPETYVRAVPHDLLDRLREEAAVVRVGTSGPSCGMPTSGRCRTGCWHGRSPPKAVARLTDRITEWADDLVAAVRPDGGGDLAKQLADLPLLTLAEVFGVPEQDRQLMVDWSSRVIGFQDPEYALIDTVDAAGVIDMARAALAVRPNPGPRGEMPDPRTRQGMPVHLRDCARRARAGHSPATT